jgi:PilZ domain
MSFGRRRQTERRAQQRCEVSRQAALYYGDEYTRVNGLVRNISLDGANFVVDLPLNLPREVVLQFWNGDEFDCDVVRDVGGTEFGLKFKDAQEFNLSETNRCVASIEHFAKSQTPHELYQLVENAGFFGDQDIEDITKSFIATYDQLVNIYSERILPHQN